jgi:mRNA interferase MazF
VTGYCPDVGDIIWVDFDPQKGREQAGRRPAIVLTPRSYNELTTLCMACPITSRSRGWRFEVAIPDGYPISGVVLADHAKSTSWEDRSAQFLCAAPPGVLDEVKEKIAALLEL